MTMICIMALRSSPRSCRHTAIRVIAAQKGARQKARARLNTSHAFKVSTVIKSAVKAHSPCFKKSFSLAYPLAGRRPCFAGCLIERFILKICCYEK
jgi:hypothetical protein